MRKAGRAACAGMVIWGLLLAGGALSARETATEVVPQERWLFRLGLARDRHDRAITRANEEGPLLEYLVPDPSVRAGLDGEVEREVQRLDLLVRYGLSDTWNLSLELPFYRIRQTSTVSDNGTNADAALEAGRLQDRTLSGPGNLRLTSLHRTLYDDTQGFIWGFGLSVPARDPESRYAGRGTLYLGSPFQEFFAWIHYDRYMLTFPGRLELHAELNTSRDSTLVNLEGIPVGVNPGNQVLVRVAWEQEIGSLFTGLGLTRFGQSRSRVNRQLQGDRVIDVSIDLKVGYGNLAALERGPIAFPYLVYLQVDRTVDGFNTPLRSEVKLVFNTYF